MSVGKIEANIRRDIITSFREWLDNPKTKIEGAERFWEYKARVLFDHIGELEKELEIFRKDRRDARNCTATYWMNYGEKVAQCHIDAEDKLRVYEKEVETKEGKNP